MTGADLSCANLSYAKLNSADLSWARFRGATLHHADLSHACLTHAYMAFVNAYEANLSWAKLTDACLKKSDFRGTVLISAYLYDADLDNTLLENSCLTGALIYYPLACPSEGAFIGWKKVNRHLVKLEIPEDAKRSSATSNKCRCDKAKVLDIIDLETQNHVDVVKNWAYYDTTYKVGKMVYPDSFDDNRWNECSHGIHFFINSSFASKKGGVIPTCEAG